MNAQNHQMRRYPYQRRAAVIVKVAIMLPVIFGFTAFGIDISHLHSVRNDLQRATDAAALAAAYALARTDDRENLFSYVEAAAQDMADRNPVGNAAVQVGPDDIVLGRATFDDTTGRFTWVEATEDGPNAVRVTLQRTVDLYFGRLIGRAQSDLSATAQAVLRPRDIALVCDLSGSMNNDSELGYYNRVAGTNINLKAIWDALGNPTYGRMTTWGTDPVTDSYDPAVDSGLLQLRYRGTWSSQGYAELTAQGYTSMEKNALKRGLYDASVENHYANRVAVTLGLAQWHSGKPPPYRNPNFDDLGLGDGDNRVESDELVWVVDYPYSSGSWVEWINHHKDMTTMNCSMRAAGSDFRFRFGLKTFVNFLLEQKSSYDETNVLWKTPEQPLQSVKDALGEIINVATEVDSGDQLCLIVFGTVSRLEESLTRTFTDIYNPADPDASVFGRLQSNHYGENLTCIGCGLDEAEQELSANARSGADKVIILLTDGQANATDATPPGSAGDVTAGGDYAVDRAQAVVANISGNIEIYTVGVGQEADMDLLDQIAEIGFAQSYWATGAVSDYAPELRRIFRELGWKRRAVLF